jgi:predicted nucleotidyltransferase
MKVAAIIAEYNPFHNGHLYQINTVREQLGADYVIIIMSGDFMQRGIPALMDKYARCEMALSCGADLVFELPSYFALGSAEYFAKGAVSLIDKLGVVDFVHFGSECGEISVLEKCAHIIADEPLEYKAALNKYLKEGSSYPAARGLAMRKIFADDEDFDIDNIFSSPNNILALEYIKALIQRKSIVKTATLARKGEGYSSENIGTDNFASANAIRTAIGNYGFDMADIRAHMPEKSFEILTRYSETDNSFLYMDDFSQILLYKLIQLGNRKDSFAEFYDVGKQLSNTIYNNIMGFTCFSEFALECKSKNLTYTRISRSLLHILLDMTQEDADLLKVNDYSQYARLLGFTARGRELLKSIKSNSSIPIITKPVNALRQPYNNSPALISLKKDIYAANIYESVKQQKTLGRFSNKVKMKNELIREIVRLA